MHDRGENVVSEKGRKKDHTGKGGGPLSAKTSLFLDGKKKDSHMLRGKKVEANCSDQGRKEEKFLRKGLLGPSSYTLREDSQVNGGLYKLATKYVRAEERW